MSVIVLIIENGEELCIRVCFIFFDANPVPQLNMRMDRVLDHIKDLSVMI